MNGYIMVLAVMAMFLLIVGSIVVLHFPTTTEIMNFFQEWKSEISQAQGRDKVAHVMVAAAPITLILGFVLSFIL